MNIVAKEESYAERRELFKNIWHAAMEIDEKDDIIKKHKVIKTLRLDDMNKFAIGVGKKERIKTLRAVCNKILEYCKQQNAGKNLHRDVEVEELGDLSTEKNKSKPIKTKWRRRTKKIRKSKSVSPNAYTNGIEAKLTTYENKNQFKETNNFRRPRISTAVILPFRYNRTAIMREALVRASKLGQITHNEPFQSTYRRVVVEKKKRPKRKTTSDIEAAISPSQGIRNSIISQSRGRAILKRVKKLLSANEVVITEPTAPCPSTCNMPKN